MTSVHIFYKFRLINFKLNHLSVRTVAGDNNLLQPFHLLHFLYTAEPLPGTVFDVLWAPVWVWGKAPAANAFHATTTWFWAFQETHLCDEVAEVWDFIIYACIFWWKCILVGNNWKRVREQIKMWVLPAECMLVYGKRYNMELQMWNIHVLVDRDVTDSKSESDGIRHFSWNQKSIRYL